MPRRKQRQTRATSSESSTSDSETSSSDTEHQTASDVINSFLNPKPRRASDVIGSFLQKKENLRPANRSQFHSALGVINSYLKKHKVVQNRRVTRSSVSGRKWKKVTDESTSSSESDSDSVVLKRRRETTESSSDSDSHCPAVKKRRIETNQRTPSTSSSKPVQANGSSSNGVSQVPATRTTIRKSSSNRNGSSNANAKSKRNAPGAFKMSFTREVFSRKMRTRRVVEQEAVIRDCEMPKDKYDRALEMLNSTECRYDETPIDYNETKTSYDIRQICNGRRHAEATYDAVKLGSSLPISLTRIVFELDYCLRNENWQQMAELIYFGCGLMKTSQSRRSIGTTFFTYALLLLILDSTPTATSTLEGKRSEIVKFLTALGSEPEESEEFLKELNLAMDESEANNGLSNEEKEEEE